MLEVTDVVKVNEVLCGYTRYELKFADSNISLRVTISAARIDGLPYPYLLCRLPNGDCITINMICGIIPNYRSQRSAEFIFQQTDGGKCILYCS